MIFSNSALSAYMVTHTLNRARIAALIRSGSKALTDTILSEIGYIGSKNSVDEIIEDARKNVFDMFIKNSSDEALNSCVKSLYDASVSKSGKGLVAIEKKLCHDIQQHMEKIKNEKVKEYFNVIVDAIKNGKKANAEVLWNIALDLKTDIDGSGFVFFWYCLKQIEFSAVKTILLGKQFGFSQDRIMENLGGLYERF